MGIFLEVIRLDELVLATRKELTQSVQEGPGFSQLLVELELELLHALPEENPHILLVQQHALAGLRLPSVCV